MAYGIIVQNVGKPADWFTVRDQGTGRRRRVTFDTRAAADEAALIIEQLRTDTALERIEVAEIL